VNAATHMVFITGCRSSRGRYIEEMPEKADSQALLLVVWGILEFPIAHPPMHALQAQTKCQHAPEWTVRASYVGTSVRVGASQG
jgi:hypothetical protein